MCLFADEGSLGTFHYTVGCYSVLLPPLHFLQLHLEKQGTLHTRAVGRGCGGEYIFIASCMCVCLHIYVLLSVFMCVCNAKKRLTIYCPEICTLNLDLSWCLVDPGLRWVYASITSL
jgi:hypothetical protein